jgi:hypothetical protein
MTAAFNTLGYDALGVDPSPCAIANALPEAGPHVSLLDSPNLDEYATGSFDLALAKDVFEHVPREEVPKLSDELLRVARQLLLVIPIAGEDGKFIFDLYERDPTHVTRLTSKMWMQVLALSSAEVQTCPDLTPKIRRSDKVAGTLSILLSK